MMTRFGLRTLAVCLIGAGLALAPQPAQARGFHGGGFRGGWGGGFRGGWGRGFRGGFAPRFYGGFYPRYRGFYPGLALGVGLGYGLGYGYGGYGYPAYYSNYGNCSCVNPGYNNYANYGYAAATPVTSLPLYVNTTAIAASPSRSLAPPATSGQSATAAQFAYYLQNNPYRQAAIRTRTANGGSSGVIKPSDLYRSASNTRTVDAPPAPGL